MGESQDYPYWESSGSMSSPNEMMAWYRDLQGHSKGIIEAHVGRIWVENEPGRGSVFSFTLPKSALAAG